MSERNREKGRVETPHEEPVAKWEYLTDTLGHIPCGAELDFYGCRGWELVSVVVIRGMFSGDCVCVFKRPLTDVTKGE